MGENKNLIIDYHDQGGTPLSLLSTGLWLYPIKPRVSALVKCLSGGFVYEM
jgi:hypothetical protein